MSAATIVSLWDAPTTRAGINEQVNYQARLLNAEGAVVPDGTYNVEFKIYQGGDGCVNGGTAPCSGTLQWTEARTDANRVTVKNGYFSVQLGAVTAFGDSVNWNEETLWLSINIGGTSGTPSWDGEMTPFRRLSATPYALNAGRLNGLDANNFLQIAPSAVQVDSGTLDSLYLNKTGASGNILRLQKNGTDIFLVDNNGNAALGAITPIEKFEVQDGNAAIYNSGNNPRLIVGDSNNPGQFGYLQWDSTNDYLRIEEDGSSNGLKINGNNVAIGDVTPDSPLKVANGTTLLMNVGATGDFLSQATTASTSAFTVLDENSDTAFNIDTSNNRIQIGGTTADATGTLLVVDNKNTTGDPTGVNGGMYYNSVSDKFRCYEAGAWKDCITSDTPSTTPPVHLTGPGNITTNSSGTFDANAVCNKPANTANGQLLVAYVFHRGPGSLSPPTGWTAFSTSTSSPYSMGIFYKAITNAASEPATYSFTQSGTTGRWICSMGLITGADLISPEDSFGSATSGGTSSMVLPEVTTATENTLLIGIGSAGLATSSFVTFSTPPGMTEIIEEGVLASSGTATSSMGIWTEDRALAGATGTRTTNMTPTASNSTGFMVAVKAEGTGGGGADLAEFYATEGDIEPGDIVVPSSGYTVKTSDKAKQSNVIGVVSTNPSNKNILAEDITDESRQPIALAGRIPLKVSLENGPIKAGDLLTSASTPGAAMKAVGPAPIIGVALESYDENSPKVSSFVTAEEQKRSTNHAGKLPAYTSDPTTWSSDVGKIMTFLKLSGGNSSGLTDQSLQKAVFDGGVVAKDTTFNGLVVFNKQVEFMDDASFNGQIALNENTAGTLTVPAGTQSVTVQFAKPHTTIPVINVTPQQFVTGASRVTNVTAKEFTVELSELQGDDIIFNWTAFDTAKSN